MGRSIILDVLCVRLVNLFLMEAVNRTNYRGEWVGLYFYRAVTGGGGATESALSLWMEEGLFVGSQYDTEFH